MAELIPPVPVERDSLFVIEQRVNAVHPDTRRRLAAEFAERTANPDGSLAHPNKLLILEGGDQVSLEMNEDFYTGKPLRRSGVFRIEITSLAAPESIRNMRFEIQSYASARYGANDRATRLDSNNPAIPTAVSEVDPTELTPELFCYLSERYGFQLTE